MLLLSVVNFAWSIMNTVLRGFLIKTFWAWFVLAVFPQLPALQVLPAIGLSFFVSVMAPWKTMTAQDWEEARSQDSDERVRIGLINAGVYTLAIAISLGSGWVVHYLMKVYGY